MRVRLRIKPIDDKILTDEIVEFCARAGYAFAKADISRAVRLTIQDRAVERRAAVMERLIETGLTREETMRADKHFALFATVFDAPEAIVVRGLKQFMFQVKRKQLQEKVGHPLMPIIMNRVQGSGKSELVLRMLKPLEELASDPVPFSEVADPRSSALFSYAVVNIDDAGRLKSGNVPDLKAAITAMHKQNRVLGTSKQRRIVNLASFIASTNENILSLVPDETGHRRFLLLPMKNGAVEKGGSPEVWSTINSLDFDLMWRSVPIDGEEPIKAVLDQLHVYQASYVPPDPILTWLMSFDPSSEAVRNITAPHGDGGQKIYAEKLYKLYCDEADDPVTNTSFGKAVKGYIDAGLPGIPFSARERSNDARYYVLKSPR
ncbi:hypothetical protein DW352_18145 [Pseudolabrys taiwanensis]|uniref:Virulence-associated protein E-like domain-containing protein n=2 Tax=Pseudolabrys taiwanensis TaxID=331696 RepID=A0A345ZZC7_9HYPH|nr:hypothetical protein DW352_18145 [Pseudolabrys taiwanensis]